MYERDIIWGSKKYSRIMKSCGIKPNMKLGQNFLIDEKIAEDQINHANITKNDTVLEIGPGLGVLTSKLAKLAKSVIAIEYDKRLYSYLKTMVPENVELINGDALALNFPSFNKFVSNIPYQISSPLLFKLIDYHFDIAIIMLQAEFAQRLCAKPNTKAYSRLTVMTSYYYEIELIHKVSKTSFFPIPKVSSAVIELVPRKDRIRAINEPLFFDFIKVVFNERRKMMKNSIISQFSKFSASKSDLKKILFQLPNMNNRPEQLAIEQLIRLSDELNHALLKN